MIARVNTISNRAFTVTLYELDSNDRPIERQSFPLPLVMLPEGVREEGYIILKAFTVESVNLTGIEEAVEHIKAKRAKECR